MPRRTGGKSKKSSGVKELVASVKKHKKFRQLASYSVQCLQKAISPPTNGWEQARKEAYEGGALDALTDVLKRHKGDATILAAASGCLTSIASEPQYAGDLVKSGALSSMIQSVEKNPEAPEGADVVNLLETVAANNPEALLGFNVTDSVVGLMKAASDNPQVVGACVRTLERINKVSGGPKALIDSGIVPELMERITKPVGAAAGEEAAFQQELLEASFRLLERMARVPDHAEYIRNECDGMQSLSSALEVHAKNDKVCRTGGRLLTKLASGNVSDLISRMQTTEKPKEREFLAGLLSNLALEDESAQKIVSGGGVSALMGCFDSTSKKTVKAASKAIGRIADDPANIDELVDSGAVGVLVKTMEENKGDAEVSASVVPTLLRFATSLSNVAKITEQRGVKAILQQMAEHPYDAQLAEQGLAFIENLPTIGFSTSLLVGEGAVPATVACLKAHPDSPTIQLNGARCLVYMADCEDHVDKIMAEDALDHILAVLASITEGKGRIGGGAGAASGAGASGASKGSKRRGKSAAAASAKKKEKKQREQLVSTFMYLLTSVSMCDDHKTYLLNSGGVDTVLSAIAHFARHESVREGAQELMQAVVGAEEVAETLAALGSTLESLMKSKSASDAKAAIEQIGRCNAFSILPSNADIIVRSGANAPKGEVAGLGVIVKAMMDVSKAGHTIPKYESILAACSNCLFGISSCVGDDEELRDMLGNSGALEGVIKAIKANPRLKSSVAAGVEFLDKYATVGNASKVILETGGVESLVAAMRANPTDPKVTLAAVDTMCRLASTDEGAIAVAKHGGARQVVAAVTYNTSTPGFREPMERMLSLLQRVAGTNEGSDQLVRVGGVDAVIAAADAVSDSARVAQSSSRVLGRLLMDEDVEMAVDDLDEMMKLVRKGKVPPVDQLKPMLSRMGHMANVGDFGAFISSKGGVENLAKVIEVVLKSEDPAVQEELLPVAFQALANLSQAPGVTIEDGLGIDALISQTVEKGVARTESMDCIRSIAGNSPAAAARLAGDGKTMDMVLDVLKQNMRNPDIATAAFGAISSLAAHADTAAVVAETQAPRLVSEWIDDMDEAPPAAIQVALQAYGNMLQSEALRERTVGDHAQMDLIKQVITTHCIDAEDANPEILQGTVQVVSRLASDSASVAKLNESGVLRKVVRGVSSHNAYVRDADAMSQTLGLIEKCAKADEETGRQLADQGSQELIVAAMNANTTSSSVVDGGAQALQALGAGAEAGRLALEEVNTLTQEIETSAETTAEDVEQLGDAVQKLSNFMLMDGVVDVENVDNYISAVSNAMSLMSDSMVARPEQLASAVSSVGRLLGMSTQMGAQSDAIGSLEMVLDVLSANDEHPAVRDAAIHTVGSVVEAGGAGVIQQLSSFGVMDAIVDAGKKDAGNQELQDLVTGTVKKITTEARACTATLVRAEGGATALASVVAANAGDPAALSATVESIGEAEGGQDALWQVLAASKQATVSDEEGGPEGATAKSSAQAKEVTCEALRVLSESLQASDVKTIKGDAMRMAGLAEAIGSALEAQEGLTAQSDTRSRLNALKLAEFSLNLLESTEVERDGATEMQKRGGLTSLLRLLEANLGDEETSARILNILANLMRSGDAEVSKIVGSEQNVKLITEAIKIHPGDAEVASGAVQVLELALEAVGMESFGMDRDGVRAIMATQASHGTMSEVGSGTSKILQAMGNKFSDEPAKLMRRQLSSAATTAGKALQAVKAEQGEDGQTYYVTAAGRSTEVPPEMVELRASVMAAAETATAQDAAEVEVVQEETVKGITSVLESFSGGDADVATACAKTLTKLSSNTENVGVIAQAGGIKAVIKAIQSQPDQTELLEVLLVLLERISRDDQFKQPVAEQGGIDVVVNIAIGRHVERKEVASRSLSVLANCAFNNEKLCQLVIDKEGVPAIQKAIMAHLDAPRLVENGMCALSNLLYASDDAKVMIAELAGEMVCSICAEQSSTDAALAKMTLRAIGNLAFVDHNIRYLADEQHATAAIVKVMAAHPDDDELQQTAVEVLSNFAAKEETEEEIAEELASIQYIMMEEGGTQAVLHLLETKRSNSSIAAACLQCLLNVCTDIEVATMLAEDQNLPEKVIETLTELDWDSELVSHCLPLIATMTDSPVAANAVAELDGVQLVLDAMETHGGDAELGEDILLNGSMTLSNLARYPDARKMILDTRATEPMFALIEQHVTYKLFVSEMLAAFTCMAQDDELSKVIGESLHIVMAAIDRYNGDAEFLTRALQCIALLAFNSDNLRSICQANGITIIINAAINHPDSRALILRGVKTLDSLSMSSRETAQLVQDEGGLELIYTILESYPKDLEIQRAGKSAVLSMQALDNLNKSAKITAKAAKDASKRKKAGGGGDITTDPLKEVRTMLAAGKLMNVWNGGSKSSCHVLVSPDFRSIVWQNPSSKAKLGAMDLRTIVSVKKGTGEGHKPRLFGPTPETKNCFTVQGERSSLDLELAVTREVDSWVDALNLLLVTFKTNPAAL